MPETLFDKIGKPGGRDAMMRKMVRIPEGYTHMGMANLDGRGMTVVVANDIGTPLVYDFERKAWVDLITKTRGGLLT